MTANRRRAARQNLWRGFAFLRPFVALTVVTFLVAAAIHVLPIVSVALYQRFFQSLQQEFQRGGADLGALLARPEVLVVFGLLLGILLVTPALRFVHQYVNRALEVRVLANIRQRLYEHVQSLSMGAFARGRTGTLMRRVMQEPEAVRQVLTEVALFPAIDVVVLAAVVVYLLRQNVWLTVILVACIPIYMVVFLVTNRRLQVHAEELRDAERDLNATIEETINGIADIQLFNGEARRSAEFEELQQRSTRSHLLLTKWFGISGEGAMTINTLGRLAMLGAGFWMLTRGRLHFDQLFAFFALSSMLFEPALRLVGVNNLYHSLIPVLEGTWELLAERPEVTDRATARALDHDPTRITFERVEFSYGPEEPVLRGLDFELVRGQVTALVGPIGCGKSTTFNLLLRFVQAQRGHVLLDGTNLVDFTIQSVRQRVSRLSQFPVFFRESIRENIRFSRPEASDLEVEEAARLAHVHEIIRERIDGGYDAPITAQFPSGGQKRLIALARCFLRRPAVLLLDEPTANLDLHEKELLKGVIREYARDAMVAIIDHDLAFIADVADRVLVMDEGRVAEQGTPAELLARGGLYARLQVLAGAEREPSGVQDLREE